jgi:hypothetical protein
MSSETSFERDLIGDTSEHDRSIGLWLGSALRAAVVSRFSLVGLGVVGLCAVVTATPAILWAIPILLAVLFTAKLLDGKARQAALRRAGAMPIRLPDTTSSSDVGVKGVIQRLADARRGIGQVLDAGPHGPGFDLGSCVAKVPQLERDVVVLAQRAEYVARFIADNPIADLLAEDRRLAERIEREKDAAHAELLRQIRAELKVRIESAKTLAQEYDRLLGTTNKALGALEGLPSAMMLLQLRRLKECHVPSALGALDAADVSEGSEEIERALASDRFAPPAQIPQGQALPSTTDA